MRFTKDKYPLICDGAYYVSSFVLDHITKIEVVSKLFKFVEKLDRDTGTLLLPNRGTLAEWRNISYKLYYVDSALFLAWKDGVNYYHSRVFVKHGDKETGIAFSVDVDKLGQAQGYLLLSVLLFKQFVELEDFVITPRKRRLKVSGEKYLNDSAYRVHVLDSRWFRNIIRTEGFSVSGHFRLQPYGKGKNQHRLTWIAPYTKKGYKLLASKKNNRE